MQLFLKEFLQIRFNPMSDSTLIKVMHHGTVVARTQPGGVRFEYRKPHDLFLEESDLLLGQKNPGSKLD